MKHLSALRCEAPVFLAMLNDTRRQVRELCHTSGHGESAVQAYRSVLYLNNELKFSCRTLGSHSSGYAELYRSNCIFVPQWLVVFHMNFISPMAVSVYFKLHLSSNLLLAERYKMIK
jgi:hypothetical protein